MRDQGVVDEEHRERVTGTVNDQCERIERVTETYSLADPW